MSEVAFDSEKGELAMGWAEYFMTYETIDKNC